MEILGFNIPIDIDLLGMLSSLVKWVLFAIVVGAAGWGLWVFFKRGAYKHIMIRRHLTGSKKVIFPEKFRLFRDEDGIEFMQLLKSKQILPLPPHDCIEVMRNGSFFVEAYYTEEGEHQFIKDDLGVTASDKKVLDIETDPKKLLKNPTSISKIKALTVYLIKKIRDGGVEPQKAKIKGKYKFIKDRNDSIESFNPLTTNQKQILVNHYRKAWAKKKQPWLNSLTQIVSITAMSIIILAGIIYWADIEEARAGALDTIASIAKDQARTELLIQELKEGKQHISNRPTDPGEPPT